MRQIKRNPVEKRESFFEQEYRLKQEAKRLAERFKNKKVNRYDIKK